MKIEYARTIPLRKILFKMGNQPTKVKNSILEYVSPFNSEAQTKLFVNVVANTWLDKELGIEGDPIDLVCRYLEREAVSCSVTDALRWLKNMMNEPTKINVTLFPDFIQDESRYEVRGQSPVSNFLLLRYLDNRLIDRRIANKYVKEVRVADRVQKRVFLAIGLRNEDGGFAVRNACRKAHIAPQTITFIRGVVPKPDSVQVFKDIFDFLTILTVRKQLEFQGDSIILNSYNCLNDVMPYITNYGYKTVQTWLPNDDHGELAQQSLKPLFDNEDCLVHVPMNHVYAPYRCPNEWFIAVNKRIG